MRKLSRHLVALCFILPVLTSCASTANETQLSQAAIQDKAAQDGAMSWTVTDKLGNKDTVVMMPIFDFQTKVTKVSSKDAKSCQNFASFSRAEQKWLAVCDAALADPALSAQNKIATEFNRALINFGLGNLDTADAVFTRLAKDNPDFAEPLAERAKIARLRYDYKASAAFAQAALARGLEKPYRGHLLLGKALEGQFDFDAARLAYQTAFDMAPNNRHVRENFERFNAIRPVLKAGR
ncbi:hypothetical protein [Fretibacter rubidus]|uniref:hypothetical protein n=1 Tax=Fretibacter rubidus TaxID=570162 RepID=UPI00352ADF45